MSPFRLKFGLATLLKPDSHLQASLRVAAEFVTHAEASQGLVKIFVMVLQIDRWVAG
jgi:hypothetical protein